MLRFAERTGLTSSRASNRYLWTDAFAVCNFLGLARETGDEVHRELALRLVDKVHHELGRHRKDDHRSGWLSGLPEAEGEVHPTRGGLRIGKARPERGADEPVDDELEWNRDGQYFHYLTKWMHALDQTARATGQPLFHSWARELADVAHRAFTYGPVGRRRMMWKVSVDLSRPLVASMGAHDPLDGFATCVALESTANEFPFARKPNLTAAIEDYRDILASQSLMTADPLGLGGLLFDAFRIAQTGMYHRLVALPLDAAAVGLRDYIATSSDLRAPARRRLAFRELGLAIGLATVPMLATASFSTSFDERGRERLAELAECSTLRDEIEGFWLDDRHQQTDTWSEHIDINEVMLATTLAPDGFLELTSSRTLLTKDLVMRHP